MKKLVMALVTTVMVFSFSFAQPMVHAQSSKEKVVTVTGKDVAQMGNVVEVIDELEQSGLNMENLSENSQSEVEKLTPEAQTFYHLYEKEVAEIKGSKKVSEKKALNFMHQASKEIKPSATYSPSYSIGGVKKYYLSNQDVRDILAITGLNGGFWTTLSAIAKIFGKNPTWITGLAIALPMLGGAALRACNRYGTGVVITDIRVGATHSVSCAPR